MQFAAHNPSDFATARFNMVESQIRPNKVTDLRILDTMGAIPREDFVPSAMTGIAYIDEDLSVAPGRYLLEPMVLARMLQEARIAHHERVLDVAPATGYSTAVIAALAKEVVAVERDGALLNAAAENISRLRIRNASFLKGELNVGAPGQGAYNVIIVNGGMEVEPTGLLAQLAEGGRLLGVHQRYGATHAAYLGEARLYEKIHGATSYRTLFDANVKLLPGFAAKPEFAF